MDSGACISPSPYSLAELPASAPPAARAVFRLLARLRHGRLDVQLPDGGSASFGSLHDAGDTRAAIRLGDWSVCAAVLEHGDIGFAESYAEGSWTTPGLAALLRLVIANRDTIETLIHGRRWGSLLLRLRHALNRNTRAGSRQNVRAHYDLGNAFYRLWLDDSMSYSSAWFDGDASRPLIDAQYAKLRRALSEAGATSGARVLEIGCGWGALTELATREFDAHVTGVTLSCEQLAYARQRLAAAGLGARADLRLQDYRDITDGPFDAIVSIEMFEAVGRAYWGEYFATLRRLLEPGGLACIQAITIRDDLFERYLRGTDFIQQYIFPGGLLPSVAAFEAEAKRAGLDVERRLAFGGDYAETLGRWRERFMAAEPNVRRLGFDTRFLRLWEFYLAYCEAAFAAGNTDVVQFTLRRR